MGIKSKKVMFTFDDTSVRTLEQMTREGQYSSMGDTVRESLEITRLLSLEARKGYSELIVRNPRTDRERLIVLPRFACIAAKAKGETE